MLTWLTTSTANAANITVELELPNAAGNEDNVIGNFGYTFTNQGGTAVTHTRVIGDFKITLTTGSELNDGSITSESVVLSEIRFDGNPNDQNPTIGNFTRDTTNRNLWTATVTPNSAGGFRIDPDLNKITPTSGNMVVLSGFSLLRIHYDAPPAFANDAAMRPVSVAENATASTNIATLDATDPNQPPTSGTDARTYPHTDTVSYSIASSADGGADRAKFTIADTNKLRFSSFIPNFENPQSAASNNQYIVVVTATSGQSPAQSVTQTLTVTVTDAAEPPSIPTALTVTGQTATPTQLDVSWTAPTNTGKPAITDYDVRYRVGSTPPGTWQDAGYDGTGTTTTLTGLTSGTAYQVQVRATNDEGTSDWTASGSGTTATNEAPTFDSADTAFSVAENSTAVTTASATDSDTGDTVSYAKSGADSAKFSINSSGVVTFASAPNFEDPASAAGTNVYTVTVTATSGAGARQLSVSKTLTVTVTDVAPEVPGAPDAPTVTRWTTTSISISWDAPSNPGPPITSYQVHIQGEFGSSSQPDYNPDDRTWEFVNLDANESYAIKVFARNTDGDGAWSNTVTVVTDNSAPAFSSSAEVSVAENTPVSTAIATVVATDGDDEDEITGYTLSGIDSRAFTLDASSGVLKFRVLPDFEAPADNFGINTYVVAITATSGRGVRQLSTDQRLIVTVTNVDEMNIGLAIGSSAEVIDERYVSSEPSWTVTFDFSEPLATEGDAAFTVADISVSGAGSATLGELTLTDAVRAVYTVPVTVTAEGGYTFQVKSGSVGVARGDSYGSAGAPLEVIYNTPPMITNFALVPPPAAGYTVGSELALELTFDDDAVAIPAGVARAERPYIVLYLGEQTDANRRYAYWKAARAANSTIVTFTYEVQAGDIANVVHWEPRLVVPETAPISNGVTQIVTTGPTDTGTGPGDGEPGVVAFPGETAAPSPGAPQPPAGPISQDTPVVGSPLIFPQTEETVQPVEPTQIPRTPLIFNEIGNGAADANDWLELRNVTDAAVPLKDWAISIVVNGEKVDKPLVVFPSDAPFSIPPNGILLLTSRPPGETRLAGGIDITNPDEYGAVHRYFVAPDVTLPDDGQFLLLLRHAKGKLGTGESLSDVAGGGGPSTDAFIADTGDAFQTDIWPLKATVHPRENTEESLVGGKVWQREKADIVGYHKDAWGQARYTGVGYKRRTAMSAATAGTPGYPNDAVKAAAAPGSVTFSEIMMDSAGGTLPQWVELYNASKTEAINLNRWELEIQNVDSEDLVGRPIVRLTLQEKVIQPNQTLLIVTGDARASSADLFPANRVYNLLELHDKNLRIKKPQDTFLSAEGFTLKLLDRTGEVVDTVGNTDGNRRTNDTPAWELPMSPVEEARSSLIRRYEKGVAEDGKVREGWVLSANINRLSADVYYGHKDDIGTPGYREGGALPVELADFSTSRTEAGVVIKWATASEVDNAGFNLRRSLTRDGGFTLLNTALIAGAGTTGERQEYTFTDASAEPGVEYYYQIEEVAFDGKREALAVRMLRGAVSAANRRLTTFGAVKQREE